MYDNTASIRHEVTGLRRDAARLRKERERLRKERDKLRAELSARDIIIAMYEHELSEALKDLDILHKVNMSLGAMIAVWVDQKKKG